MQSCEVCGEPFWPYPKIDGTHLNLRGRKRCLNCRPHRPQRKPRKRALRPVMLKTCENCGRSFRAKIEIEGEVHSLYRRRFCLDCSPFGSHNTSKQPSGAIPPEELIEHRRKRRNAKTYRWLKKKRRRLKAELVGAQGGRCADCGYSRSIAALEFHHRDPGTKEFQIGNINTSRARVLSEIAKCDLLCANCHRIKHVLRDETRGAHPVVAHRRRRKIRAVAYMGGRCFGCRRDGPPATFEFHHRDAREKDFGLSEQGIPHSWAKVVAELTKCVMLCANCHREVHAGLRELEEDWLLGLAEAEATYVA